MKIKVTQDDIDLGSKRSINFCPVAIAFMRELNITYVEVYKSFTFFLENQYMSVRFPPKVTEFIKKFDTNQEVEPFEFDIKWSQTITIS